MRAIIIANADFNDAQREKLVQIIRECSLIVTCNFGFIQLNDVIVNKFYLARHINISVDPEVIISLEMITAKDVKFYHSQNFLEGYQPMNSTKCPVSGWWDSGTHAIVTVLKDYPFITSITAFGFSDGAPPNFYFKKSRLDALSKCGMEDREINFIT